MESVNETGARGVSRRTVVKGAAWSVPVIAAAVAAPAAAASGIECEPLVLTIPPTAQEVGTTSLTLTQVANGDTYAITISSTLGADTVTGQSTPNQPGTPIEDFNLSTAGYGWAGGPWPDGSADGIFADFTPGGSGAIVINQRSMTDPEPEGTGAFGVDVQTLTFTFTRNGVPFDPTALSFEVFDITSAVGTSWRNHYWDTVGFSIPPGSVQLVMAPPGYGPGVGAGTFADPYRRVSGNQQTFPVSPTIDRFTFASFPSGSQMQYSNWEFRGGWHYIAISGLTFQYEGCV